MSVQEFNGHVSAMRADSEFFGAEDFVGKGDVPVQIVKCNRCVDVVACGRKQKELFTLMLVVDGKPATKALWIKATNRKKIVKLYGPNVSEWKQKWLWLYVDEVQSPQGGLTLGIRIRDKTDAPTNTTQSPTTTQKTQQPTDNLADLFMAMKDKWKGRRTERGLPVDKDDFAEFVFQATGGLVPPKNALNVPSYSAELIAKCVQVIRESMPEGV